MQVIKLQSITIGPRQRKKMEPAALVDLKNSILANGLIHPPTYRNIPASDGGSSEVWQLVAGERRTRAIQKIAEEGLSFWCQDVEIKPGELPILVLRETVSQVGRKQIEFDENKLREQLPWQDESEALAEIHRLRLAENVNATLKETAEELVTTGVVENITAPALVNKIRQATIIAENLSDPKIANARNATEAYNLIIKGEEEKINAALAKRRLQAAPDGETSITIREGSCVQILPTLDAGLADLILGDPPFGINADTGGFRQRTVHHHNYEDTPEKAREIYQAILLDGFRVAKPMANVFLFCDIDMFMMLREMAGRIGWVPFRTPLIWQKSHSEGMAPWQGKGPRRTYEMIFYATKGQRGLISSPVDIFDYKRVPRDERIHAAQKPVDLLSRIIECSTLPGDFVLDPCCGSGSTLVAARALRRRGLGIEVDKTFYNTAMSNVYAPTQSPSAADPGGTVAHSGTEVRGGADLQSLA